MALGSAVCGLHTGEACRAPAPEPAPGCGGCGGAALAMPLGKERRIEPTGLRGEGADLEEQANASACRIGRDQLDLVGTGAQEVLVEVRGSFRVGRVQAPREVLLAGRLEVGVEHLGELGWARDAVLPEQSGIEAELDLQRTDGHATQRPPLERRFRAAQGLACAVGRGRAEPPDVALVPGCRPFGEVLPQPVRLIVEAQAQLGGRCVRPRRSGARAGSRPREADADQDAEGRAEAHEGNTIGTPRFGRQ
jgi:hypothetical protein